MSLIIFVRILPDQFKIIEINFKIIKIDTLVND